MACRVLAVRSVFTYGKAVLRTKWVVGSRITQADGNGCGYEDGGQERCVNDSQQGAGKPRHRRTCSDD